MSPTDRPASDQAPTSPVRQIRVFFYGLLIDEAILRDNGATPTDPRQAVVDDYRLRIGSKATLVPANGERVYGMVFTVPAPELRDIYAAPGLHCYYPEAVVVETLEGEQLPAVCYNLAVEPDHSERDAGYADQLRVKLAAVGLPSDHVPGPAA
ncbi:MAG: gamma-glutamylcyclotransferase [bacterium]|nr:gamma-glutamylcyclotransferase [bacterium]